MRIGLVVYGDIQQRTGGYIYDRLLAEHLTLRGFSVEVLSLRDPGCPRNGDLTPLALAEHLRRAHYGLLLHDELCHPCLNAVNDALAAEHAVPSVAIVHNLGHTAAPAPERELLRRSEQRYLEGVVGIITNSAFTLQQVRALLAVKPPCMIAYPSLGFERVAPAAVAVLRNARSRLDPLRLLSVGNLSALKGTTELLRALGALTHEAWRLELVGSTSRDPHYVADVRTLIDALSLRERVELRGELRDAELAAAYEGADLMVLASPREGFGMAYLEAMSFGLPVVASRDGAAPELIRHGCEGWLFQPNVDLGDVLQLALTQRDALPILGAAAARRAQQHPTWSATAERVATFLSALAAGKNMKAISGDSRRGGS